MADPLDDALLSRVLRPPPRDDDEARALARLRADDDALDACWERAQAQGLAPFAHPGRAFAPRARYAGLEGEAEAPSHRASRCPLCEPGAPYEPHELRPHPPTRRALDALLFTPARYATLEALAAEALARVGLGAPERFVWRALERGELRPHGVVREHFGAGSAALWSDPAVTLVDPWSPAAQRALEREGLHASLADDLLLSLGIALAPDHDPASPYAPWAALWLAGAALEGFHVPSRTATLGVPLAPLDARAAWQLVAREREGPALARARALVGGYFVRLRAARCEGFDDGDARPLAPALLAAVYPGLAPPRARELERAPGAQGDALLARLLEAGGARGPRSAEALAALRGALGDDPQVFALRGDRSVLARERIGYGRVALALGDGLGLALVACEDD